MPSNDVPVPDDQPTDAEQGDIPQEGAAEPDGPVLGEPPAFDDRESEPEGVEEEPPREVALIWPDELVPESEEAQPLEVERLIRTHRLLESTGALLWREVRVVPVDPALGRPEALTAFHDPNYTQAVVALSEGQASVWSAGAYGFSQEGFYPYPGMASIAGQYVAAVRTAVRTVLEGSTTRALSPAGGQPHAGVARASTGNIFNDIVLALMDARAGGHKVAFINLDAEHPCEVQERFEEDPDLLMISLHEGPEFLYPGTGLIEELGGETAKGRTVNLPLPPAAGDPEFLWLFEQVIEPLLDHFLPDLIVVLGGASSHAADPLSHLRLTSHGYQTLLEKIDRVAGRLIVLGGSGSNPDVTARLWTLALAVLCRRVEALPQQLPGAYAETWDAGPLFDDPLPRLSREMQVYVTRSLQQDTYRLQRLLFPLWNLPVANEALEEEVDYVRRPRVPAATPVEIEPPARVREVQQRRLTTDEARAVLHDEEEQAGNGGDHDSGGGKRARGKGGRRRRKGPRREQGETDQKERSASRRSQAGGKGRSSKRKGRKRGKPNKKGAPGRNSGSGGKQDRGRNRRGGGA